jgi:L-lactate dehydrogenase
MSELEISVFEAPHEQSYNQSQAKRIRLPRIAIVGPGLVGSTTAYALLISGIASEIVLIGRDLRRTEGQIHDLRDAGVFSQQTRIVAGDLDACCAAEVTIIAVGASQRDATSRLDGMRETAEALKVIVCDVARFNPEGILLLASNPVDVMTYAAWKWSGLSPSRVIGSGTSLDTARFRRRVAEKYRVASDNVHAYIIGEHGDSQFPVLSSARIAGVPLDEFCKQRDLVCSDKELEEIARDTRTAGAQIVDAKGATYYGIGAALVRIVRAILRDENAILTVSSVIPESLRLGRVALSLPSIVNHDGIDHVLSIPLSAPEKQLLAVSSSTLKTYAAQLGL